MKKCSVCGKECNRLVKGMCIKHYQQVMKHGEILERTKYDPNEIVKYDDYAEVVLYNNQCKEIARALIDLDDIDKVKQYKWSIINKYVVCKSKKIRLHRLIMDCPDDKVVDHINHNKLDNRKSNLRICTQHQNNINVSTRKTNTSGKTGVSLDKRRNKWRARVQINGKEKHLGYFDTKEDAIEARKQAEIDAYGEYRNKDNEDVS